MNMTIYTAVRMKDGVHYIASNIMQCTKQLKATECTGFSNQTNYILIQFRLNSHLQFFEFGCRYENVLNLIMLTSRRWRSQIWRFRICTSALTLSDAATFQSHRYWLVSPAVCVLPSNINYFPCMQYSQLRCHFMATLQHETTMSSSLSEPQ